MLAEFMEPDATAVFLLDDGPRAMRFADLLPLAFDTKTQ
jgi:cytidine deaminase